MNYTVRNITYSANKPVKGRLADTFQTIPKGYIHQLAFSGSIRGIKCIIRYMPNIITENKINSSAFGSRVSKHITIRGKIADIFRIPSNFRQTSATSKRPIVNARNTVRNRYACQSGATVK